MENLLILYLNNNAIDRIRDDSFVNFGQNLTDLWLQNNGYEFTILFPLKSDASVYISGVLLWYHGHVTCRSATN